MFKRFEMIGRFVITAMICGTLIVCCLILRSVTHEVSFKGAGYSNSISIRVEDGTIGGFGKR